MVALIIKYPLQLTRLVFSVSGILKTNNSGLNHLSLYFNNNYEKGILILFVWMRGAVFYNQTSPLTKMQGYSFVYELGFGQMIILALFFLLVY